MECNIFWEYAELEEYSIYSTSESGIAERRGIAGIVVTDLDKLWTFILFHLNWNRWSLEYLFQLFLFLKSLKQNTA